MDAVAAQLAEKVREAPGFFNHTPLIIDLERLTAADTRADLSVLVSLLRRRDFVPVGIRGGNEQDNRLAQAMDLAVFPNASGESAKVASPQKERRPPGKTGTRLVNSPVRSGQQVYARGGDLVVLAPVSAGAEIIADGNIHVYDTLRGRALAGVKGDQGCRIFCMDLQAELVAISGHYRISENIDDAVRKKPVQVYLDGDSLMIEAISL